MVKPKHKKKRKPINRLQKPKAPVIQKPNPFDLKFNKQKHQVAGKKLTKADSGRPGLSRSLAFQKRKKTLFAEFQSQGKDNVFADKRVTSRDDEQRIKLAHIVRSSQLNNNPEVPLTHGGKALVELEPKELTKKPDDSETQKRGHLLPWQQQILDSKQMKLEKQQINDEMMELTEELDTKWKELCDSMSGYKGKASEFANNETDNAYDAILNDLRFNPSKKATDGGVSERKKPDKATVPETFEEFIQELGGLGSSADQVDFLSGTLETYQDSFLSPDRKKEIRLLCDHIFKYLCQDETSSPKLSDVGQFLPVFDLLVSLDAKFLKTVLEKALGIRSKAYSTQPSKRLRVKNTTTALLLVATHVVTSCNGFEDLADIVIMFSTSVLSRLSMKKSVLQGLLLSSATVKYVQRFKKYVPELVVFLTNVLQKLLPNDVDVSAAELKKYDDECSSETDKNTSAAFSAISTLLELARLYRELPSCPAIFGDAMDFTMKLLQKETTSDELKTIAEDFVKMVKEPQALKRLSKKKQVPMIKMLEPRFEENFNPDKPKGKVRRSKKQILVAKHKRAFKGAARELRRDNEFLARVSLADTIRKDEQRKDKVKKIYSMLANQEGELRTLKRKSK